MPEEHLIHLVFSPPLSERHTASCTVSPSEVTLRQLLSIVATPAIANASIAERCETYSTVNKEVRQSISPKQLRVSYNGRPLWQLDRTLFDQNVNESGLLAVYGRLRGGSPMTLKVKSRFGIRCGRCMCECCGNGRMYTVQTQNIADVSSIIDSLKEQNPLIEKKNMTPVLLSKKWEVLDPDRKIISYDVDDGDELFIVLAPTYWFFKQFRRSSEEIWQEREAEQEAKATKTGSQNVEPA